MLLSGRALFVCPSAQRVPRRADALDTARPCAHPTLCQASQGWYAGEVQHKAPAGPLKAPLDTRQRRQQEERRESNSQASTSQGHRQKFEFDATSQLGTKSKAQLGGSRVRKRTRGVPNAWVFDIRDLELLDPDQQHRHSSAPDK